MKPRLTLPGSGLRMRAWLLLLAAWGLIVFTSYSTSAALHGHPFPPPGTTGFAVTWLAGSAVLTAARAWLLRPPQRKTPRC